MVEASQSPRVKMVCGMISSRKELFETALGPLSGLLGPVDMVGEIMNFDFTHYYDAQMGSPLYRRFVAFSQLASADVLVDAKLGTNRIEREIAASVAASPTHGAGPARAINLDPGYVESSKLVLASMKNFSHRIYMGRGVYAEVTLMYHRAGWDALPWIFPDYASGRYDGFLTAVRQRLREQLQEAGQ